MWNAIIMTLPVSAWHSYTIWNMGWFTEGIGTYDLAISGIASCDFRSENSIPAIQAG